MFDEPNTPPLLGTWYTPRQAAEIFKVAVGTIHQWSRTGPLNGIRRGNRIYFAEDEIQRVASQRYEKRLRQNEKAEATGLLPKRPIDPPSIVHMGAFADPHWTDHPNSSSSSSSISSSKNALKIGGRGANSPRIGGRGAEWITPTAAASILGITKGALHDLARRNKLSRRRTTPADSVNRHPSSVKPQRPTPNAQRPHWLYLESDVQSLAEKRAKLKALRQDPRHNLKHWGDRRRIPDWLPVDEFITTRDAAYILNCTPENVAHLVRTGVLPGFQKRPGKQGSPLKLVRMHVASLSNREEYKRKRARWEKGRKRGDSINCSKLCRGPQHCALNGQNPPCNPRYTPGWEENGLDPINPRRNTKLTERDYGEFYSTRQVALYLGISRSRVYGLMRTGALKGYQRPLRYNRTSIYHREPRTGNRWWFFKKENVRELRLNPDYERRRRAWQQANTKEAREKRELEKLHAWLDEMEEAKAVFEKQRGPSPFYDSDHWKLHLR